MKQKFTGPIQNIAFIFAMEGEARPVIERSGLKEINNINGAEFGLRAFHAEVGKVCVYISLNGKCPRHAVDNIGTESATLNAYHTIRDFKPDLLINAGTAGGFRHHGSEIGDVYFSVGNIMNHDHRIPIPGFFEYGRGSFPVLPLTNLPEKMGGKRGIVSTGNSLDATEVDLSILREFGAAIKEMEAAAIARVAEQMRTPFFAIKSITDFADDANNHDAFLNNYNKACEVLGDTLERLISFLGEGRNLEDL